MAKAKAKAGRVSMSDLRAMINKKAKRNIIYFQKLITFLVMGY